MTTPYMTGTVAVTAGSAVVTGSGTAWQTALVAGGLFGLDSANGNPVPILSVDSDTRLTLAKPWRGTTASGQAYWIIRDTAYLQQMVTNAQALATYIQRLDNAALAALAGLTPAADRMAYFTGSGSAALAAITGAARALLNLSGSAGNGKIPVLTGSAAAAIRDIVGTVSQSGGVPTGAIVERGSNANGDYVKFADGTMICTHRVLHTADDWSTAMGSFFRPAAAYTWTFPAAFADLPDFTPKIQRGSLIALSCNVYSVSATQGGYLPWSSTALIATAVKVAYLVAIGRWF